MAQQDLPPTPLSSADCEILSSERRRAALAVLRERGRPLSLAALAEDIVRAELGAKDPDPEAVHQCRLMLYHAHIPKLADAELVRYNPRERTASYGGGDSLNSWLSFFGEGSGE